MKPRRITVVERPAKTEAASSSPPHSGALWRLQSNLLGGCAATARTAKRSGSLKPSGTVVSLLVLALFTALLVACGGNTTDEPTEDAPAALPTPEGALPREHAISAADLSPEDGIDFCGTYPETSAEPFTHEADSPFLLFVENHAFGPEDAQSSIVYFGDLLCDTCRNLIPLLRALSEERAAGETIRVALWHFTPDDKPRIAGTAAEAAAVVGGTDAFWEMAQAIAESEENLAAFDEDELRDALIDIAEEIGLNADDFEDAFNDSAIVAIVRDATTQAQLLGVVRSPVLLVDNLALDTPPTDLEALHSLVDVVQLQSRYIAPPPMVLEPDTDYVAWIETEKGTIAVNLFADLAPLTVNNFAYLACAGFYDDITWHRVIPGFVAQSGDPSGTGFGGPGYTIPDEYQGSALTFDDAGYLSMARNDPNSARSQFFITLGPAEHLTGQFTIFGEVVDGLAVVEAITARDPAGGGSLPPGDTLVSITVRAVPE